MMNIINTDLSVKKFIIILKDLVSFNIVMKVSELHTKNFAEGIEQLNDLDTDVHNNILEVIHARNESLTDNKDINQSDNDESMNRHNFDVSENQISSVIYNRNDENDDSDDVSKSLSAKSKSKASLINVQNHSINSININSTKSYK
ncbi:hypothetical protein EMPG_10161 [Blastomyces silverae]|uniref:Uncharacterized protein n=1 Tax=Blastomyces silverae TaxID=2060906 RepID=A0A0H1B4U0_9EURO|nr:hypothetical protein EMPG_10161 [Blastomyces silverae]